MKFIGTSNDLMDHLNKFKQKGEYSVNPPNNAFVFRSPDGGIINFYKSTQTILLQGKDLAQDRLLNILAKSDKFRAEKTSATEMMLSNSVSGLISNNAIETSINIDRYHVKWEPLENITTYELALCIPYITNASSLHLLYDMMPPEVQKHFSRTKY